MAKQKDNSGRVSSSVRFNGRKYTVNAKSKRELAKKKRELLNQLESGTMIINNGTTVSVWAEQWLEAYCLNSMGAGSYNNYASIVRNHIIPAIGNMKLKDVRPIHCQRILNGQKGRSTSFLSKIRNTLHSMFQRAKKEGLISVNPADDLELPAGTSGSRRSICREERKAILSLAETHRSGLYIKVLLYCGLRPAECIPLQWCDLDLDDGYIHVTKALKKGSEEVGPPKSASGVRDVPIPDVLLNDLRSAARNSSPFDFVFRQPTTGKMHTRSSLRCAWNNFKRALDIQMGAKVYRNQIIVHAVADDLCPYCLRHTYGTDLQDAGVPINVAKYLMGHSDISVTANIYTDTTTTAVEAARAAINKAHCTSICTSAENKAN